MPGKGATHQLLSGQLGRGPTPMVSYLCDCGDRGFPNRQLGMMRQEQVGQKVRVLGVILGVAGDEGFTILLEGDGVDGVEVDPVVSLQEGDEVDGGLFQTQADASFRLLLPECQQPFPKGFGRGVDDFGPALAGAGVNEAEVGLFVGTVQADDEVIGMRGVHDVCFFVWWLPQSA